MSQELSAEQLDALTEMTRITKAMAICTLLIVACLGAAFYCSFKSNSGLTAAAMVITWMFIAHVMDNLTNDMKKRCAVLRRIYEGKDG